MSTKQVVVELHAKRLPHLNHPDWVAFESVLRSLQTLEDLPIGILAEGLYAFAKLPGGSFTAEQVLDGIDRVTANIRVALANQRAAQSKL